MDRYVLVNQGEVFYMTEALAQLEGLERGPAGNTALAAAFALAQEMDQDQIIVVQETEYTGAGKHIQAQLTFARENGIDIFFGNPEEEVKGKNIILPEHPSMMKAREVDMNKLRASFIKNAVAGAEGFLSQEELDYLVQETKQQKLLCWKK
jgi:2-amino-4-ketopentanoate thiolase beta subunit